MRALLAAAALLALLPSAAAHAATAGAVEPPGWACIPEQPVCGPMQVLCPRLGGLAGYCVRASAGIGEASVDAAAGHLWGPNARGSATVALVDLDGDGSPDLVALAGAAEARACPAWLEGLDVAVDPDLGPLPGCRVQEAVVIVAEV